MYVVRFAFIIVCYKVRLFVHAGSMNMRKKRVFDYIAQLIRARNKIHMKRMGQEHQKHQQKKKRIMNKTIQQNGIICAIDGEAVQKKNHIFIVLYVISMLN